MKYPTGEHKYRQEIERLADLTFLQAVAWAGRRVDWDDLMEHLVYDHHWVKLRPASLDVLRHTTSPWAFADLGWEHGDDTDLDHVLKGFAKACMHKDIESVFTACFFWDFPTVVDLAVVLHKEGIYAQLTDSERNSVQAMKKRLKVVNTLRRIAQ